MNRETENVLLLLVGISGVLIVATGTFTRYVKPSLAPWLVAAAVLMIILAVAAIIRDVRSPVLWLLPVPVLVLVFITPPAIGAQAPSAAFPAAVEKRPFPPLPPGPVPEVSIPDVLIRIAQDSAGTLEGRRIMLTGFTVRVDGQVDLGRVVIICCAADAQLARIGLQGPLAESVQGLHDGRWLRVEGEVMPGQNAVRVYAVTEVDAPPNPYTY